MTIYFCTLKNISKFRLTSITVTPIDRIVGMFPRCGGKIIDILYPFSRETVVR